MVPLKYLKKFWRACEIPLINFENNVILTWSANCFIVAGTVANQVPTFAITDPTLCVPVLTSSTHDNPKLLHN